MPTISTITNIQNYLEKATFVSHYYGKITIAGSKQMLQKDLKHVLKI